MRRMKCPNSSRPASASASTSPAPMTDTAAVHEALARLARIVAGPGFARPESLTWDGITDYALALIRLRECACAAGLKRLTQACDALAVTVSRLIDEKRCASHDRLLSLKRFVAHARAMIPAPASPPTLPAVAPRHAPTRPRRVHPPLRGRLVPA